MNYESVIGLEIHVQVKTQSKLFCGCSTVSAYKRDIPPNSHICPICTGHPGVLPRPVNRKAVELAVRLAAALGARVNPKSDFDRKNYFYADLPKGYQITQHGTPIAEGGAVDYILNGTDHRINIHHLHLEEDPGRSKIEGGVWLVDMNRCGIPLIEIVTEPDIRSAEEAAAFVAEFQRIVRYLGVSEANMDLGNLRCDANVSIRPSADAPLGTKTEIKNLNSMRFLEEAVKWEIRRQNRIIDSGVAIDQITISWDERAGAGKVSREKESEADYRYFREPNLIPVDLSPTFIKDNSEEIPELPSSRLRRFIDEYKIKQQEATSLVEDRATADYFEAVASQCRSKKRVADWIRNHVIRVVNDPDTPYSQIVELPIPVESLVALMGLLDDKEITDGIAQQVFEHMIETGKTPAQIISSEGLKPPEEEDLISKVDQALAEDPETLRRYKEGNDKVLNRLIGVIMKGTQGKADAQRVRTLLIERADLL